MKKTNFLSTKKAIINWLDHYGVKDYTLLEDSDYGYVVDVMGEVDLEDRNLRVIPVKFHKISGGFWCRENQLTTLEFAPKTVGGVFSCAFNKIISLEFCPTSIGVAFDCRNNKLTSLKRCPATLAKDFYCSQNQLTSLEYGPITVGGSFYCDYNQLTSLEFCPTTVGGDFHCGENKITSLEFCPAEVRGQFYCEGNLMLGKNKNINDFVQILKIHKETLIKKEKDSIDKELGKLEGIDVFTNKSVLKI